MKTTSKILIAALFCLMLAFTGCNNEKKKAHEDIAIQIAAIEPNITSLKETAEDYYRNRGVITEELYGKIEVLATDFNDAKSLFENSDGYGNDEQISSRLRDIQSRLTEYQNQLSETMGGDTDVSKDIADLTDKLNSLRPYVEKAYSDKKITQERFNEFNTIASELDIIRSSNKSDLSTRARLVQMQETLAVMASEVGASNSIIDSLAGSPREELTSETTTERTTSRSSRDYDDDDDEDYDYDDDDDNYDYDEDDDRDYDYDEDDDEDYDSNSDDDEEESTPKVDVDKLQSDYNDIQNQASRDYERGDISDEDYNKILETGKAINDMKTSGDTSKAEDIQSQLDEAAKKVG